MSPGLGAGPGPGLGAVSGPASGPSPEEMAAIVAAVEMAWPRPVVFDAGAAAGAGAGATSPWRFSGRWWSKPTTVRRARPWVERVSG